MGMYDSVICICPNCGNRIELQSKVGDCKLKDYAQYKVPIRVAEDLDGEEVCCGKCERSFIAKTSSPKWATIQLFYVIPEYEGYDKD